MIEDKIEMDLKGLKKIVEVTTPKIYQKAMYDLAINEYIESHKKIYVQGKEQPKNFNAFELTVNKIIYESNSRFKR